LNVLAASEEDLGHLLTVLIVAVEMDWK